MTTPRQGRVVIVHGTLGHPNENWFPWLSQTVRQLGADATVPELPTPERQSLPEWIAAFDSQVGQLDGETILVGHSLGAAFVLRLLERLRTPVRAAYLVSAFIGPLGLSQFDPLNVSFFVNPFDWKRIRSRSQRFRLFHGDDDPYVPVDRAREVAIGCQAELTLIEGGGHLNSAAGFIQFEPLFEEIREQYSP